MLADAHRKAAEDIESTILSLQAQPRAARVVIEGAWGAAFQWIAFVGADSSVGHTMKVRKPMQLDLQAIPPWLDEETSALVREKAELLAQRHPDVLAIILYGSVARHEERSLEVPDPSDVDLLVVLNGNRDAVRSQMLALVHTAGLAEDRHLSAPREVKVLFSSRTSQEWDPDFIANVKRDGRILYRRGELPAPFAA